MARQAHPARGWLERQYADTQQFILANPFGDESETDAGEQEP